MKKTNIAVLFVLGALAGAAGASPSVMKGPGGTFTLSGTADPGFRKTELRCQTQDPCTGISGSMILQAGIGGGSGDIHGGGSGGIEKFYQASVEKVVIPAGDGSTQSVWPKKASADMKPFFIRKPGQFTVGGQYVVGAHISPHWDGRVHL